MEGIATPARTFNTPLEAGLRALFLLVVGGRKSLDVQRLVYLDYLLVHTGDVDGPKSLHPVTPSRKGELLVRRALLQEGLDLMRSRSLLERRLQKSGIGFRATAAGSHLASQFESTYANLLRARAEWVMGKFGDASADALARTLGARMQEWEDELIYDNRPGDHAA
jgi:hypothetical protein